MSYIGNSPGVASQRVTTTLTATAGQTQFTTQSGYVLGYVDVYLNGAKLVNGSDFEAITGTYITLFSGASAGDVVELISYVPRGLSDGYTKAEADAKFLDVGGDTASGNLAFATASLTGNLTLSGGTANGIGYLNGSKVLTTGSALTFDGTNFATTGIITSGSSVLSTASGNTARMIAGAGGAYFGSTTAADVIFQYNQNEGMRLTSTALYTSSSVSIGIGTANPATKLDVNGGAIFRGNTTVASGNILYLSNSVNTASGTLYCPGGGSLSLASYGNEMIRLNEDNAIIFKVGSATERARIDSSGNLTIGPNGTANTNSSKLVVAGTISQTVGGTQYLVVDQSDIGTAQNQIPLNQYLGSMAFQDRENINFTGGTGTLSSLDIAAVSQQLNVSATDVFVYDTSRDSDGGAWRNRCQHTSWYNETLNTTTRGSRREFPAVAVIVAVAASLTIYDGDDPTLPMWMVFAGQGSPSYGMMYGSSGVGVSATNGIIGVAGGYIRFFSFIQDFAWLYDTSAKYSFNNQNLANRNAYSVSGSTPTLMSGGVLSSSTNDVAMTVLPNAPIDPATGLPIPTIAVATNGGVSVLRDDGSIKNITHGNADYSYSYDVIFTKKNQLRVSMDSTSRRFFRTYNIPSSNISVDQWVPSSDDGVTAYINYANGDIAHGGNISATTSNAVGTAASGLTVFEETLLGSTALHATITSKSNTGWMVGNGSKGAWMSDITQETMVGTELVANGDFSNGTTGWTAVGSGASISVSSGQLNITTGTEAWAGAYTTVPVVSGKTYVITGTIVNTNGWAGISGSMAGANSGSKVFNGAYPSGSTATPYTFTYTATTTGTLYVTIDHSNTTSSTTIVADNISVRIADPDRSANNKGLQVFGNITKTPVAAGADLVAYSGFSESNYLMQPYNSALDFGTGDFSVSAWVYWTGGVGGQNSTIVCRKDPDSANNWTFQISAADSTLNVYNNGGINLAGGVIPTNTWVNVHLVRRAGVAYLYQNAVQKSSASMTLSVTATTEVYVGRRGASYTAVFGGSLSLIRISATAPSAEQIAKMYNDEKVLFQEGAKATLYGISDAISALAYDEDTGLLHAGTSSGRSTFQGLRRISNTTTAVSSTISAANGLVVEN